jgi:hypothetical protein
MKIIVGRYVRVYFYLGLLLGMVGIIYHITNLHPFEYVINYEDVIFGICFLPFYFGLAILYNSLPKGFCYHKDTGNNNNIFSVWKGKV